MLKRKGAGGSGSGIEYLRKDEIPQLRVVEKIIGVKFLGPMNINILELDWIQIIVEGSEVMQLNLTQADLTSCKTFEDVARYIKNVLPWQNMFTAFNIHANYFELIISDMQNYVDTAMIKYVDIHSQSVTNHTGENEVENIKNEYITLQVQQS